MNTTELFLELLQSGIQLWTEGDELCYRAAQGTLTPDQRAELAQHKAEIVALLAPGAKYALPSFAQQRLWFLDQFEPGSFLYNIPSHWRLTGEMDVAALEASLHEIARRHQTLRTTFPAIEGQSFQVIHPAQPVTLPVIDLSQLPESEREAAVERLIIEETRRPFDLAHGPLWRVSLLRLSAVEHVLLLTMHHIISDGWSMGVLFQEWAALYAALSQGQPAALPELPIQYADFAHWQRQWLQGEVLEAQLAYWKQQLADLPILELPTDRPRPPVQTHRGASQLLVLPQPLSESLQALSRGEEVTLFMVLLTAFQTLLMRYTGQHDIVTGCPIANRNRPEIEGLIGLFVNTLVLRTDVSGDPTFRELLSRVREVALGAYAHQDVPFEKLVEELHPARDMSHGPLFQVMLVLQNAPRPSRAMAGLTLTPFRVQGSRAKFDLTLTLIEEAQGLTGRWEYNTDLFDDATISRMMGHFQVLLEGIVANPEQRLSDLPLLTAAERHQVLVEWNNTATEYPRNACLHQLFEAQVEKTPDAVAVVFGDKCLTYRELNACANQLAHHLQKLGVGPESLVGICVERSLEMMVGLLGILKAGGAYLPLDPTYPQERLSFMIEDTQVPVLLTQQRFVGNLYEHKAKVVQVDTDWQVITQYSQTNPASETTAESLAYVMYTSGSTGMPKGIAIPHRAVSRLVFNTNYVKLESSDRVAQASNISFDAATFEIWGALLQGARLVGVTKEVALSPIDFAAHIHEQEISVLFLTTALFNQLASTVPWAFQSVRYLLFGGEAVDPRWVAEVLKNDPPQRLLHVYGPTESTTFASWCLMHDVPETAATVPIGRPISNTQIYLLDRHLQPVPIGVAGELHISGDGLARGYLNRPKLTAEKFIANPFSNEPGARLYKTGDLARYLPDGNIEFLGRVDHQVKIRGYRIELGEIEAVLSQHPAVREAVVLARQDQPDDKRLVAYLVAAPEEAPAISELRHHLQAKLPEYMVPAAFVLLEALPLTPNGKVDRRALPAPDQARSDLQDTFVAPRDRLELQLAMIWGKLLRVRPIGVRDNFFELGGHSLLAVRLFAEIEKLSGKNLPLATLFQSPTIEQLANILRNEGWTPPWSSLVAIQPGGSSPPLFCTHAGGGNVLFYRELAHHLGADQPVYALQARGLDGRQSPFTRVEDMAAHYIKEMRTLQPEGPYFLIGRCFGLKVAFEMSRQLHRQGQKVNLLASLDTKLIESPIRRHGKLFTNNRLSRYKAYRILQKIEDHLPDLIRHPHQELARLWRSLLWRIKIKAYKLYRNTGRPIPRILLKFHIEESNRQAARDYTPQIRPIHPGRVTLFKAQERSPVREPEASLGEWASDGVEIHVIPGDHLSMLREPHVQVLSKQLRTCLDKTQSEEATNAR